MTGRPPLDSLHVPRMDDDAAGCCMEALQHDCLNLPETPKGDCAWDSSLPGLPMSSSCSHAVRNCLLVPLAVGVVLGMVTNWLMLLSRTSSSQSLTGCYAPMQPRR